MARTYRKNSHHWLRKPRTQSERRLVAASTDDEGVKIPVRAKRNARHLPTEWDDRPIAHTSYELRTLLNPEHRTPYLK